MHLYRHVIRSGRYNIITNFGVLPALPADSRLPKNFKQYIILFLFSFLAMASNAQQLSSRDRKMLTAELEKAFDLDQQVRKEFNKCITDHGGANPCTELRQQLERQDSINQQVVFPILDKYGWIPVRLISKKANSAFFYVIQHAQVEPQIKYAHLVDTAFKRKEISPVEYAYFVDRLRSKQGKAQLYGTQTVTDNLGNTYPYPIENWTVADSLRKLIGAEPLDEYLPSSGLRYHQLPKLDFSKYCLLIGHIWSQKNQPVDSVKVAIGTEQIGLTDANGFFMIAIEKNKVVGAKLTLEKTGFKNAYYPIKGEMDFYDIYAMLR
ncbi:hypothetical protein CLV59_107125 [Chitinophaga dinghuensis]|uniref:Uncharacterized protein n=1 Tax=Chitinophaga dinghuensis TaxID=1539050 RepID=A0A327VTS6_9BACT|nr:DUF6624 domain-containing protein [Chitinophaga dinghuensis]RAJ77358.1 hypothetical protein CLV59_107125 [Chitinophaga dinghuensis]